MAYSRRFFLISILIIALLVTASLLIVSGIRTSSLSHSGEDSEKIV